MIEKLKKIMEKKGEKIKPEEIEPKKAAIKEMQDLAKSLMGEGVKGLQKVTVASDSKEGLKKGLEMAEEKLEESDKPQISPKMEEDKEEDESEMEGLEKEELLALQKKIEALIAKKA